MEEIYLMSWDRLEQFYKSQDWPYVNLLTLIAELRQRGYDRQLLSQWRPGCFLLSPTGISHHDAKLGIYLMKNGGMLLIYNNGAGIEIQTEIERVAFTPELESLLERLAAHSID